MSRIMTLLVALAIAIALVPVLPATAVGERVTIDFEGLPEGTIVSSVASGSGISGDAITGSVGVRGWRDGARGTQRAMIFDGTCAPWNNRFGCTGQDTDLFFPDRGNILIVSEDLDASDPDDDTNGGFTLDFSGIGPVTVESVGILDTNNQTTRLTFTLTDGTTVDRTVGGTGDGRSTDASFGIAGVASLEIDLNGAGAIDDIVLTLEAPATTTTAAPTTTTTTSTTTTVPSGGSTGTTAPTTTTTTTTTLPPASDGLAVMPFVDGIAAGTGPGPERSPGSTAILTYEVTNTSNRTAWSLYLWQEGVGGITCADRTLEPGETVVCEGSVQVPAGTFSERVDATAWPESGELTGSAVVHFTGVADAPTDSGFVNVALGQPTTQANTNNWNVATPPRLAVDGNRDGDHDGGSVAMTFRVSDAWWEVDLGEVYDIDHITLWNRTDCCADRLREFYVFVSDVPFEVKDLKNTLTQDGVTAIYQADAVGRRIDLPVERTGRYVRVQVTYDDAVLQLAEVEVMVADTTPVTPPPDAGPTLDLAVEQTATEIAPGEQIGFTYRATNTGTTPLWALYVWHEGVGRADCPDRSLAPGETVECTITDTPATGSHVEPVTAQAWDDAGTEAAASAVVEYAVVLDGATAGPALDLELLLDGAVASSPGPLVPFGSDITWTYRITNTGSEQLWALYLAHDGVGSITCPTRDLAPGAEVICERTVSAEAGEHTDRVSASAWDSAGTRAGDVAVAAYRTDLATTARGIELEAKVAGDPADSAPGPVVAAGGTIPLTFDVTNTGGTDLWGLWVNAPGFGTATCPDRHIPAGGTVMCSLSPSAAPGLFASTVRAIAYDDAGGEVEDSDPLHVFVPASAGPAVRLDVLVDGLNGDRAAGPRIEEGQTMTFSYLVENRGSVPLTDVSISDTTHGAISCPRTTVQPGETLVCTLRQTARLILTHFDTTVTARAGTVTVRDTERLYYHVKPFGREDELLLEVSINGVDADAAPGPTLEVGRTAQIRYVLTNNAREATMWSAEILDPRVPRSQMSCVGGPTLGHYQSMICTTTIVVQPGQWSNLVVGHAWSNNGPRLDASDRIHYYGIL